VPTHIYGVDLNFSEYVPFEKKVFICIVQALMGCVLIWMIGGLGFGHTTAIVKEIWN